VAATAKGYPEDYDSNYGRVREECVLSQRCWAERIAFVAVNAATAALQDVSRRIYVYR
jgi:hypothetical protein